MTQQPNEQPRPTRERTLLDDKLDTCRKLQGIFSNPLMDERLMKMAGGDASRVAKNLTAFLSLITEDEGTGKAGAKKFFCYCTITSLTTVFLESMNMGLPFDSRKLVSIIIYDNQATLDISYKGFLNALNRHYTDAFVECKLVFEGDHFESEIADRTAKYVYKPKNPFAVVTDSFEGILGGYCFFSYTDKDGGKTSRLVFLSRAQILKNKSRAQTDYVWKSDPKAMAEKTCIREGSKIPFAAIDLDIDVEGVDNRHYKLEGNDTSGRIAKLLEAQEGVLNNAPPKPKADEPPPAEGAVDKAGKEAVPEGAEPTDKHQQPASAGVATVDGGEDSAGFALSGEEGVKKPITDADFEEMSTPDTAPRAVDAPQTHQVTPVNHQVEASNHQVDPIWDSRTIYMGEGKTIEKEFNTSSAFVYLKKVMSARNTKASRQALFDGNHLLMEALKNNNQAAAVDDLLKLVEQGK